MRNLWIDDRLQLRDDGVSHFSQAIATKRSALWRFVAASAFALAKPADRPPAAVDREEAMTKTLSIEGMSCKHCVMHVKNALEETAGVESAEVDLEKKSAIVVGGELDDAALSAAVADAGYEVVAIS
jgi:copper chaperone